MNKHQLLTQTRDAFAKWRREPTQGKVTPQALREMAAALSQYYSSSYICQQLGISSSNYKLWLRHAQAPQFITLLGEEPQEKHTLSLFLSVDEQQQITL